MNKGKVMLIAAIVIILAVTSAVWIIFYNKIVSMDEQVISSWAQVETVLQQRYDLIPNLIGVVQVYATQEKGLFDETARLQAEWGSSKAMADKVRSANAIESVLARVVVVADNYAGLKANPNYIALQKALADSENQIKGERSRFNEAVKGYNSVIRRFPSNIVAGLHGYGKRDVYFDFNEPAAKEKKL